MLSKIKENKSKITAAIGIIFCFAVIRAFENQLFYDPFLEYFEKDFKNLPFPQIDSLKLFIGLLIRYVLNTGLSLALIYILFTDNDMLLFSAVLYVFFGVILMALFYTILKFFPEDKWLLFYVRRFIIQPIFILIFIPAFYYQLQYYKK